MIWNRRKLRRFALAAALTVASAEAQADAPPLTDQGAAKSPTGLSVPPRDHRLEAAPGQHSSVGRAVVQQVQHTQAQGSAQAAAGRQGSSGSSSVSAELQKIFSANGQPMPSMRQQDLPNGGVYSPQMMRPKPQPEPRPSLLKRIFGRFGRKEQTQDTAVDVPKPPPIVMPNGSHLGSPARPAAPGRPSPATQQPPASNANSPSGGSVPFRQASQARGVPGSQGQPQQPASVRPGTAQSGPRPVEPRRPGMQTPQQQPGGTPQRGPGTPAQNSGNTAGIRARSVSSAASPTERPAGTSVSPTPQSASVTPPDANGFIDPFSDEATTREAGPVMLDLDSLVNDSGPVQTPRTPAEQRDSSVEDAAASEPGADIPNAVSNEAADSVDNPFTGVTIDTSAEQFYLMPESVSGTDSARSDADASPGTVEVPAVPLISKESGTDAAASARPDPQSGGGSEADISTSAAPADEDRFESVEFKAAERARSTEVRELPEVGTAEAEPSPVEVRTARPSSSDNGGLLYDGEAYPMEDFDSELPTINLPSAPTPVPAGQPPRPASVPAEAPAAETPAETKAELPPVVNPRLEAERQRQAAANQRRDTQRRQIASRSGMHGFKGFCPVMLRNHRELVDSSRQFETTFGLRTYHFSSQEAKDAFDADPTRFAPAAGGSDVVLLVNSGEDQIGMLDFALWYRDRLYLFRSRETMSIFSRNPQQYANQY